PDRRGHHLYRHPSPHTRLANACRTGDSRRSTHAFRAAHDQRRTSNRYRLNGRGQPDHQTEHHLSWGNFMNVSVLIMTLNEEVNLPACVASLDWCDDIVILDSYSSDRTVEIAKAAGARVFQRNYDTEDRQRMYGLTEISFKHDWVYTPDADEI